MQAISLGCIKAFYKMKANIQYFTEQILPRIEDASEIIMNIR